jgi:hypothetical protein
VIPKQAISEALDLLPAKMRSPIGLQESRFVHRRQMVGSPPRPTGPAKGFWQFERGGGCIGVINHPASRPHMQRVCEARGVAFDADSLWNAIEFDDVLAAAAARLLLYTDPRALPKLGEPAAAWDFYLRVWRPGKPHRATWDGFYLEAFDHVAQF